MSLLAEFELSSSKWVASEEALQVRRAASPRLAQGVLPLAPERVLEQAIAQAPGNFSTLQTAREQMASILSAPDGMNAVANLLIDGLAQDTQQISEQATELAASLQALVDGFGAMPAASDPETQASLVRGLADVASRIEEQERALGVVDVAASTASTVDAILELVDSGALDKGQVQAWVDQNAVVKTTLAAAKLQRVEQLGERYWRISVVSNSGTEAAHEVRKGTRLAGLDKGFVFEDEQGVRIDQLSGVKSALLMASGELITQGGVGLAQNEMRVFKIAPLQASPAPRGRFVSVAGSLSSGANNELDTQREALEQASGFDIWACVVLDLSERIDRLWGQINQRIQNIYFKIRRQFERIVSGEFILGLPSIGVNWKGAISELERALGLNVGVFDASLGQLIAVTQQFGIIRLGEPSGVLCEVEQSRHCQIHTALLKLGVELDRLKQMSRMRLTGETMLELAQRLGWNPEVMLQGLNALFAPLDALVAQGEEARSRVRAQVCAWVRRRQQSVPPSVSQMLSVTVQIGVALALITPQLTPLVFGVPFDPRLGNVAKKLGRMGFDAARDALDQLDVVDAMVLTDRTASYAGQTSSTLAQAASLSGAASRSQRLQNMSEVTADRHNQLVAHQRFRSRMQARYHAQASALEAKAIQEQGRALIIEVERETNQF